MSDELLPFYNRELAFIRHLGNEFAEAHPQIAGRLRLGPDGSEDPHVERMIEAFAYLNARTRYKLEDDFPEITDALLGVLYPHYQAPIPSMAVVQFVLDRGQGELTTGYSIPRHAPIETDPIDGEPCRFRTCYPTTIWPIELAAAGLSVRPFTAPNVPYASQSVAALRLELRCFSKEMTFAQLDVNSLRFFLRGQSQHVHALYELVFNNVLGVALANSPGDHEPVLLDRHRLKPVGFHRDEGMLPYPNRAFMGYRILTEYFAFPQKFLFFDLEGLSPQALQKIGNKLEIYIFFDRTEPDLEQNVSADTLRLGCAPIVNLYRQRADPIKLTHTQTEYRVVPDARRPLASEVYSVDSVVATSASKKPADVEYQPFYSFKHASDRTRQKTFWYATRRPAGGGSPQVDHGTEIYLSLVDLAFDPAAAADWTLNVETTCINRDLPHRLAIGEGQSHFRLAAGGPLSRIESMTGRPTPTIRPALKHEARWQLISHLSLNHLSLVDYEEGADALREILRLYDFGNSVETRSMIDGILGVAGRRVVGRTGGAVSGFARGLEVAIHFDEDRFSGGGVFLFASVLERFLGLYCSINSFSKLIATTNRREGKLCQWPPRAGETVLL
ncbi:MAG: type VI secretion system baseplate subunit TssF [Candidatus Nealsonbacteria bacterium]|nr:type VI secretion system baseplate subunit TssF [Candidatus Nealsonbacteria bacterium]